MTKPKPWSHSALSQFKNCPRQYHEVRIAKSVVETKGEATIWGEEVHKHFEDRMVDGVVLPMILETHEPFLKRFETLPGHHTYEEKIALNTAGRPCEFFAPDVWYRGVIDAKVVHEDVAILIDYKTGKHHTKFQQLKLFALHTFAAHPQVDIVRAEYYWTQTKTKNGVSYTRDQIPAYWQEFIPDLKQYAQAFRDDLWQPRQSGLCNGWCPVETCEFWRPKRRKG
ncbi:MAG: PD-(D/E)XK nuclease family protein [bacterium]|nr:PD-(D/E)XK nuclease family protein [bacterium]